MSTKIVDTKYCLGSSARIKYLLTGLDTCYSWRIFYLSALTSLENDTIMQR